MLEDHVFIESGPSRARITLRGAALTQLSLDDRVLVADFDADQKVFGGSLLAPWPNRVRNGTYKFMGRQYQLEHNDPLGNALHGTVFSQRAKILNQTSASVTVVNHVQASAGYPSDLEISTTYEVFMDELKVSHVATNVGTSLAPVGLGAHPYFVCDSNSTVTIGAKTASIHDSQMIPAAKKPASDLGLGLGVQRKIAELELDTQFEDLDFVSATLKTSEGSFNLWQENANYLMVYVSKNFPWSDQPGLAIALEPQTCEVDAFNSGAGLRVLEPSNSTTMNWGIRLAR